MDSVESGARGERLPAPRRCHGSVLREPKAEVIRTALYPCRHAVGSGMVTSAAVTLP